MTEMKELKEWAAEHNYTENLTDYIKEREQLSIDCMRDGLEPYGYDFQLRDEALKNFYNEIFNDKEQIQEREESLKIADTLIRNDGIPDIIKALSDFYNNHNINEPYLWEDTQHVIYDTMEKKLDTLGELPNQYFTQDAVDNIVDAMQSILNQEDLSHKKTKYQLLNIELDKEIEIPRYFDTGSLEAEKYMADMINQSTKYDSIQEVSINILFNKDRINELAETTSNNINQNKERYEELYKPLEEKIQASINTDIHPEYKYVQTVIYNVYRDIHLEPDKRAEDIFPCESLQEQYNKECERIAKECAEEKLQDEYEKRIAELYAEPRFDMLRENKATEMYSGLDPEALLYMATSTPLYQEFEGLYKIMLDQEPEREKRHMPEYDYGDINALYYLSQTEGITDQTLAEYCLKDNIEQSIQDEIKLNIEDSMSYNYDIRDTNRNKDISKEESIEFEGDVDEYDIDMEIDEDEIDEPGAVDLFDINHDGIVDDDERSAADERDEEFEFEL